VTKKWMMGMVTVGMLAAGLLDAAAYTQLKFGGEGVIPGDDSWDIGYGASAQVIFWTDSGLGLALSAGAQIWDVNDDVTGYVEDVGGGFVAKYREGFEGDAVMLPLGASGLYRIALGETTSLILEGGLRYVIVNSNVKFVEAFEVDDATGNALVEAMSYDIDLDNGVVGLVGGDFEVALSESFNLFAGAGYQFDVLKGDISVVGIDSDVENELKAFYARAGISLDI